MNIVASKISERNRKKKFLAFLEYFNPKLNETILDVGFSDKEYSKADNYLEKHYMFPDQITALGVDEPFEFIKRYPKVKAIKYDGYFFPFQDNMFDIGWSNAVIEHVGKTERQQLFIKELKRTCKRVFFTTPNRYFPIEIHTGIPLLHYLPKKWFDTILILLNKRWASQDYMNLLSRGDIIKLLKESGIKNFVIKRNHFLFFTLDFMIMIG